MLGDLLGFASDTQGTLVESKNAPSSSKGSWDGNVAEEKQADSGKLLCASGSKGIKDGVSPSMNVCEGSVPNHGSLFAQTVLALPGIIIS